MQHHSYRARRVEEEKAPESLWFESVQKQYTRCQGQEVLLAVGLCPKMDEQFNLDRDFNKSCLTNQLLKCFEDIFQKKRYLLLIFIRLFPSIPWPFMSRRGIHASLRNVQECRRKKKRYNCDCDEINATTSPVIHCIALAAELAVAQREYGIRFCGVFGFSAPVCQNVPEEVLTIVPGLQDLPRGS